MDLSKANVEFHIEELVLHGFEGHDRHLIAAAVQQELGRLLSEGVPRALAQTSEVANLNGGNIQITSAMKPDEIGFQIAQSIYGGLQQ